MSNEDIPLLSTPIIKKSYSNFNDTNMNGSNSREKPSTNRNFINHLSERKNNNQNSGGRDLTINDIPPSQDPPQYLREKLADLNIQSNLIAIDLGGCNLTGIS